MFLRQLLNCQKIIKLNKEYNIHSLHFIYSVENKTTFKYLSWQWYINLIHFSSGGSPQAIGGQLLLQQLLADLVVALRGLNRQEVTISLVNIIICKDDNMYPPPGISLLYPQRVVAWHRASSAPPSAPRCSCSPGRAGCQLGALQQCCGWATAYQWRASHSMGWWI